jgi:hypothetical protein
MKKKFSLLLVLLSFTLAVNSQNAFYNAQYFAKLDVNELKSIIEFNKNAKSLNDEPKNVIEKFSLTPNEVNETENLILFLEKPFQVNDSLREPNILIIQSIIKKWNSFLELQKQNQNLPMGGAKSNYLASASNGISMVSSLSFLPTLITGTQNFNTAQMDTLLLGLTKYIAEEFKKAQTTTYLEIFAKTLGQQGDLQILFPETFKKLKNLNPTNLPNFGDELNIVFDDDFKNMTSNLINHIKNCNSDALPNGAKLEILTKDNCNKIKADPNFGYFALSMEIVSQLANNNHIVEMINYFDLSYYEPNSTSDDAKIGNIFHGINLIQKNLRDTTKSINGQFNSIWVSLEQLNNLKAKEKFYFIGLLYQQDKEFFKKHFENSSSLIRQTVNDLNSFEIEYNKTFKNYILPTFFNLIKINEFVKSKNGVYSSDEFIVYLNLFFDVIKSYSIDGNNLSNYFEIIDNSMNIYNCITKKSYSNLPMYIGETLEILTQNCNVNEEIKVKIFTSINKYGSFMSDVVNSENSEEVKELIKSHVAPPESFINKRNYPFTFSVTSMPGYYISIEKFDGNNEKIHFNSGISLPIGFDLTWKVNYDKKKKLIYILPTGIFFSVIDLGAMLNFTYMNNGLSLPDEVKLEHIFSPGFSFDWGIPKSPVTLVIGYQYAPQLREITVDGNNLTPNSHRILFRLSWDIPLIDIAKKK